MALTKPNAQTSAAAANAQGFEPMDDDTENGAGAAATETRALSPDERVAAAVAKKAAEGATAAAAASAAAAPAEAAESTSRAVTQAAKPGALAASIMSQDPTAACENALRVDYNTLTQIMVTNGNVALKETVELMGDHVGLELISFQNHFVCSPGGDKDDDEAKEFLKYSDDGKTVRETGELLTDALQRAKDAGYSKAKISERLIVVGALIFPGKDKKGNVLTELQDELVQIDLAPRSMGNFKAYRANVAFKVSRGLVAPDAARRICMSAKVQSKNGNNWTDADFKVLTDDDMK